MERRKRRSFTPEFREGTKSLPQVAKDLELTEPALRLWVKQADEAEGKAAPGALSQAEREELVQLLFRGGLEVKFEFIDAQKAHFPIELMCEQLWCWGVWQAS
jgi:transposase